MLVCVLCRETTTTSTQSVMEPDHDGELLSRSAQAPAQTSLLQPEEQTAVSPTRVCSSSDVPVCVCSQKHNISSVCFIVFSLLLSSRDVSGDVHTAVHTMRSRFLLSGQRAEVRPVGRHPCGLHQPGQLLGSGAERRGPSGL